MSELDRGDEQRIRRDALSAALGLEHKFVHAPVQDDVHKSGCLAEAGIGDCDCPPWPPTKRLAKARELEDAAIDRVLRVTEVFAAYIADGVTPQQVRGERLDEDLRAVLGSEGR